MKPSTRLFAALYILIAVYLLLSFIYGKYGLVSTSGLISYRQQLYNNILELKRINTSLERQLQPLNTMENIKLKARELGYIAGDEKKIYLQGIEKTSIYHSLGTIIFRENSSRDNSPLIRSVSLIFSLLFYILSSILLTGRNGTGKKSRNNRQYIEMPQQ